MDVLIAAAIGVAVFAVLVLVLWGTSREEVEARLANIAALDAPTLEEIELSQPLLDRTVRPLLARVSRLASRASSPGMLSRTDERLAAAGYPGGMHTTEFVAIRWLLAILAAGLAFFFTVVLGRQLIVGLIITFALGGVCYLAPEFWLSARISTRRTAIVLGLPDTLDLLTISVRAGLGFDSALSKVIEKSRGPLPDELRRVLAEIRVGRPRRDALRDMAARVDVLPLTNFVGAIVQAEQLGVPISRVLQVQSEQLRVERRQRAEELAARAPIKMLFPLVGCVFPAMFIVILGPAIILIILNLAPVAH